MTLQKSILYANLMLEKHFLVSSMLKTVVVLYIFVETVVHFFKGSLMKVQNLSTYLK